MALAMTSLLISGCMCEGKGHDLLSKKPPLPSPSTIREVAKPMISLPNASSLVCVTRIDLTLLKFSLLSHTYDDLSIPRWLVFFLLCSYKCHESPTAVPLPGWCESCRGHLSIFGFHFPPTSTHPSQLVAASPADVSGRLVPDQIGRPATIA